MDPDDPAFPAAPPADPDDWTDEQWIAWLKATDAEAELESDSHPTTQMGRAVHSSGGQVLGQAMLGMAQAIYGRKQDDVAIVAEGPSEPDEDEPFTLKLDPDHPERSTVTFRNSDRST